MLLPDLPIAEYHASKRVSHSKLKTYVECGARGYYLAHEQKKWKREDTEAFIAGRAMEDALQRPDVYRDTYVLKPAGMNFSTKEGKAWRADQEAAGKTIVDGASAKAITALLESRDSNTLACALMEAATIQPTIYVEDKLPWAVPGIQARPDWLHLEGCAASDWCPYSLDLKTVDKLDELVSGRSILRHGYHQQAAKVRLCLEYHDFNTHGMRHYLLAAEKSFPNRWQVIQLPPALVDRGELWCTTQLMALGRHYESGSWPLVDSELVVADVPAWMGDEEAA